MKFDLRDLELFVAVADAGQHRAGGRALAHRRLGGQ